MNDRYCPNRFVTRGEMAAFLVRAFGLTANGAGDRFVDDEGSYAESEILDMWNRGFTEGCDWNKFCPTGTLTRGEIATFVARAMDGES